MPAPHRRAIGESLATSLSKSKRTDGVADPRDRLVASRDRHSKKWESLSGVLDRATSQKPPIVRGPVVGPRPDPRTPSRKEKEDARREQMRIDNSKEESARAFQRVLAQPCPAHNANPGEPCWWPVDRMALCGDRIARTGFNGVVSERSSSRSSKATR